MRDVLAALLIVAAGALLLEFELRRRRIAVDRLRWLPVDERDASQPDELELERDPDAAPPADDPRRSVSLEHQAALDYSTRSEEDDSP